MNRRPLALILAALVVIVPLNAQPAPDYWALQA